MANMDNGKLSPEAMNALIKMASGQLGMTPQQLKEMMSKPDASDQILSKLGSQKGSQVKSAMNDKQALEKMLNSNPMAKKMIEELLKNKK